MRTTPYRFAARIISDSGRSAHHKFLKVLSAGVLDSECMPPQNFDLEPTLLVKHLWKQKGAIARKVEIKTNQSV